MNRRKILLCLALLLLASCTPTAEAQAPHNTPAPSDPLKVDDSTDTKDTSNSPIAPDRTPAPPPTLAEDFDPVDFLGKSSIEIKALSQTSQRLRAEEGMPVVLYPLLKDDENGQYAYDKQHEITLIRLPNDFLLGTGDLFAMREKPREGQTAVPEIQAAILPHLVGGQPFFGLAILSAGIRDLSSGEYLPKFEYARPAEAGILADSTYFGGRDTIYPNKLQNILIAVSYMAEYQGDNGAFQSMDGYSFNNLIRLRGGDTLRYANGANNLWAAGVCAVASLTSATLYDLSQSLEVDYTDSLTSIIRTQYQHQIAAPYAGCPYIPVNVDTVVAVLPDLSADLVWQMPPEPSEAFLAIDTSVIPNQVAFEDTAPDGIDGLSDAELLVTMSFTTTDPGPQAGAIQSQLSSYRIFRSSQHEDVQGKLANGTSAAFRAWDEGPWQEIITAILPLE